ncbi:hypothetical protein DY000_02022665 [Brassica cretica]|uniref:Uncharacterized protein n=1 Tax=Brassica cretica TaxID=69181 RepID=A0ABQ7EB39_BRACR|nr:hypothetical protein DY000_02022665 [Brassica cretica]
MPIGDFTSHFGVLLLIVCGLSIRSRLVLTKIRQDLRREEVGVGEAGGSEVQSAVASSVVASDRTGSTQLDDVVVDDRFMSRMEVDPGNAFLGRWGQIMSTRTAGRRSTLMRM